VRLWTSYFHQEYGSADFLDAIRPGCYGRSERFQIRPRTHNCMCGGGEPSYTNATQLGEGAAVSPPDHSRHSELKNQGIPVVVWLVLRTSWITTGTVS